MPLDALIKKIGKALTFSQRVFRTYTFPFLLACSGSAQSFTAQEDINAQENPNTAGHDAGPSLSEPCADADEDGFYASKNCGTPVDCNDYNSAAYPGAREYCDGLDNNCNGTIDEKPPKLLYADRDGDGFGNPEEKVQSCFPPRDPKGEEIPYVSDGGDCDDNNSSINPDAEDLCDYTDNDCDGIADNLFPDAGSECYEGVGECRRSGKYECSADGRSLLCPATPGISIDELCNGRDDDCDGETDEELEAETRTCYAGQGECRRNGLEYRVCERKSGWSIDYRNCDAPAVPAGEERCDEIDHDCDGNNYNGFNVGEECSRGEGECFARGEYACTADGEGTFCDAGIIDAEEEICDGRDNDCDGEVDETIEPLNPGRCIEDGLCSLLFSDSGDVALDGSNPAPGTELTSTGWSIAGGPSETPHYSEAAAHGGSLSMSTSGNNGAGVQYEIRPARESLDISIWYRTEEAAADSIVLENNGATAHLKINTGRACGSSSPFEYEFSDLAGNSGSRLEIPGVPSYEANRWYHFQISVRGRGVTFRVNDNDTEGIVCQTLSEPVHWSRLAFGVSRCGGGNHTAYWDDLAGMVPEE